MIAGVAKRIAGLSDEQCQRATEYASHVPPPLRTGRYLNLKHLPIDRTHCFTYHDDGA
jgi:hypothetical protein